jgi:cobalt/nickel transport system permease protein
MHIPDGYLSPQTEAVFAAAMVPVYVAAARNVRKIVKSRYVPLLAIGAAFSFLVMMLNVPIPGGTTAHAVGGVLVAVILGPWAAVIAVSIALLVQALFFGDGGVLAFAANAFNMAVVMPCTGYAVYRLISRGTALTSPRRALAAGLAGYVGLNVAALFAAIEFGLQPALFHAADGTPLYAPFHLSQTIPTMAFAHLTVAGLSEFAITLGVVAYLQRANLPVLRINAPDVPVTEAELARRSRAPGWVWALAGLGLLVAITPLGLLAPGGAFGEDAPQNLDLAKYGLSNVPLGLQKWSGFWSHAVLGGYGFHSGDHPVLAYLISATVGILIIGAIGFAVVLLLRSADAVAFAKRHLHAGRAHRAARAAASSVRSVSAQPGAVAKRPHGARGGAAPGWLFQSEVAMCPCGCIGVRRKGSFLEKTLTGTSNLMRQAMFSEDVASQSGFLQRIDARVKILALLALLVVTALLRNVPALVAMYGVTLGLAAASSLPLGFFVKRVWLFVPIFTGIVVIPAMFSFITPGHIVVPLWDWHGHAVGLTSQGIRGAALIVTRVATSISFVVLLTLTTPWVRLLAALRALMVPRVFVLVIGMAYRYIFLLLNSITDLFVARKARSAGADTRDHRAGARFVASAAGALFGKSHALSEEVHQAMTSRGYRGEARTLGGFGVHAIDVWFAVGSVSIAILALGGDRLLGR